MLTREKSVVFDLVFKPEVPLRFRKFTQLTMVHPDVFEVFYGHSRDCYIVFKPGVPCYFCKFSQLTLVPLEVFEGFRWGSRDCYTILAPR